MVHERKRPTRTFMNTDYGELAKERYKDFKDGYNKAIDKACDWMERWFIDSRYYTPQEVLDSFRKAMGISGHQEGIPSKPCKPDKNTIDSTKLIELVDADYKMLKEKGKEGEEVLHYNGYLDGFSLGYCTGKDLTWQDIKRIVEIADDERLLQHCAEYGWTKEQYYTEVLRRFKEE